MSELKPFKLTLTQAHTKKIVSLGVVATDWDSANSLADALSNLMPSSVEYFDKQDAFVTAYWGGMTEEITETAEDQPWLG